MDPDRRVPEMRGTDLHHGHVGGELTAAGLPYLRVLPRVHCGRKRDRVHAGFDDRRPYQENHVMAKKLTAAKAKKILRDDEVHGKPLTAKQKKLFGAVAGGQKPRKGR